MSENFDNKDMLPKTDDGFKPNISPAVIRRLPRYYRYLRELITHGRMRISSGELAGLMEIGRAHV